MTERPQLLSVLLFTLVALAVERYRQGGRRWIRWVPVIILLWGNTHAEVTIGLLYLAGMAAGEFLDGRRAEARGLAAATGASLAAALLNPGGWGALRQAVIHLSIEEVGWVEEFVWGSPTAAPLLWVMLAAAAALLLVRREGRSWAEALTLVGLAALGLRYVREVPYSLVVAALAVHRRLGSAGREPARLAAAASLLLAAAGLAWAIGIDRQLDYRWGTGIREDMQPSAAVDFLERHPLPGILYNHYNQSGYLIHRGRGVFQDSRTSAYPREFISRLHGGHGGANWASLFDDYGVNSALVRTAEVGALFPAARWGVVYWDPGFALLVRRVAGNQAVLEDLEYRVFLPGSASGGEGMAELTALAVEMRRNNAERREPSPVVARELGIVLGRLRRYQEAADALEQAVALAPRDADAWAYLGRAREMTGRRDASREAYRRALDLDPGNQRAARWLNP